MKEITLVLNGEKRNVYVKPTELLLDVLRDKFGLKSPKCGCGRGDCGTCAVLIDGKSVKSCLVLGIEVDGLEVRTLEGLMDNGMTNMQEKMLEGNSFQCGFCAPGFVVMGHELLEENKNPSKEEIKEALSGNLCRCTGYTPIIEAVEKTCNCKG